MPPVISVVLGLLVSTVGVGATVAIVNFVTYGLLLAGANFVIGSVSKLLTKKPNFSVLSSDSLNRAVTVRQPISARRVIYGTVGRLGGVITFMHVEGTTNQFLHLVITLSGHQVQAINTMYFDNVAVPLDGAGNATGNFAGFVFVEKNLGTTTQAAFADMVAKSGGKWTSVHQQKGRAGVHVRLKWDANKFPNGVPNITFDIDGALVYDPRANTTGFSNNAALCLADYLTNTAYGLGAATQKATRIQTSGGASTTKLIGDTGLTTNRQAYEALVYVENLGAKVVTVADNFGHSVQVPVGAKANVYLTWIGDAVNTNELIFKAPATGDSLDFLVFKSILRRVGFDENQFTTADFTGGQWTAGSGVTLTRTQNHIASVEVDRAAMITAANICDEAVTLNAGGTEARYTTNGVIDTSIVPADAISSLLTAMAGYVTYSNAVFKMYAGAYVSPTESISEGDLRGDIVIQTTRPKRDLFNGVKGLFVSPTNGWQPTDFPPKQDATYLARDRGEAIWKDVELPFTTSVPTAQRLAKIDLQRNGRQVSLALPLKLSKYTIAPLDVINVSLARLGWVNKTFEVASVNLVFDDKGQQGYIIGVDVQVREIDASVYAWTPGTDEAASSATQTVVLPDNSNLSNLDNGIVDGSTYSRAGAFGKNLCPNPGFELNTVNAPASDIPVGSPACDGWTVTSKTNPGSPLFSALANPVGTSFSRTGNVHLGISVLPNISIPNNPGFFYECRVQSAKVPIRQGDIIRVAGYGRWDFNIGIPAGLTIVQRIAIVLYDSNDAFIASPVNDNTNNVLGAGYHLQQVAYQVSAANAAYVRVECSAFVGNASGGAVSTPNGLCADLRYDDLMFVIQATAFDLTPINTSGHATVTTGALSQSGVSGTILVASKTLQFGDGAITYSSGSVSPGLGGPYFVYADDPTYSGGAVTYVATLNESDVYAANGRIYFGKITLTGGGGGTSPNPPGTGGGRVPL